jgi:hypothetical protein
MKTMQWKFKALASLAVIGGLLLVQSCGEDDPTPITLTAVTAGGIDLNGATAPSNVPTDATITATFSTNVDPASANETSIKLTRDYDGAEIPVTISTTGAVVTVNPDENLSTGTLFVLSVTDGLKSTEGVTLTALDRSFTTVGSFAPSGEIPQWNFQKSCNSVVGCFNAS